MKQLISFLLLIGFQYSMGQVAVDFDGTNDYVQMTSAGPQGAADRTVECWFKTTNVISNQQVLVDWGNASPLGARFTLNYIGNGRLRIEVGGNGFNTNQQITDGNWHHVAVTYDDTAAIKACIYLDGVLDTCRNFTRAVNTTNTNPILIGRRVDATNYFQGSIDEVRIWNVVRSASQISRFRSDEYCNVPSGLLAYYKFEEGVAGASNTGNNSVTDYAGNNNGTLTNLSLSGNSSNWVNGVTLNTFQIPKTITQNGDSLFFNAPNINSYRWFNCNTTIFYPNDTNYYFVPPSSGSYAVLIDAGTCIDTSNCYAFTAVGIQEKSIDNLYHLNGNVVNQQVQISVQTNAFLHFQLLDIRGRVISEKRSKSQSEIYFEMSEALGLYFLRVRDQEGNSKMHKLIKVN